MNGQPLAQRRRVSAGERHDHLRDEAFYLYKLTGLTGELLFKMVWQVYERECEPYGPDKDARDEVLRAIGHPEQFGADPVGEWRKQQERERQRAGGSNGAEAEEEVRDPDDLLAELDTYRVVAGTAARPDDIDDWFVSGIARPGSFTVLGSEESAGKSFVRIDMAVRAAGWEALEPEQRYFLGQFTVPSALRVMAFDAENGATIEWAREEQALSALGIERAALGDRLERYSYAPVMLGSKPGQRMVEAAVARSRPQVIWFDTGGAMVDDEWGKELKPVYRFLRDLAVTYQCAVIVAVHLVRPSRDSRGREVNERKLSHVMGWWTKWADCVAILFATGKEENRYHFVTRKRFGEVKSIIARAGGVWETVSLGEELPGLSLGLTPTDLAILEHVADDLSLPGDEAGYKARFRVGRARFFTRRKALEGKYLTQDGRGKWSVTEDGLAAIGHDVGEWDEEGEVQSKSSPESTLFDLD